MTCDHTMGYFSQLPFYPRNNEDQCIGAAKAQYETRGKPMASTGWSPSQVHMYVKWQLSKFETGKCRRGELGGFAWTLPKKGADGRPADLPPEVIRFQKSSKANKDDPRTGNSFQIKLFKTDMTMTWSWKISGCQYCYLRVAVP